MCNALVRLKDGLGFRTCGVCRECGERRVRDLTGRCVAEHRSPGVVQAFAVDLTFRNLPDGGLPISAQVLRYRRDIKPFYQAVRAAPLLDGSSSRVGGVLVRHVRYMICGEFGALKGRAHWHAVMFIRGAELRHPEWAKREDQWDLWPHASPGSRRRM